LKNIVIDFQPCLTIYIIGHEGKRGMERLWQRVGENFPKLIKDLKLFCKVSPESLLIGIRSSSSLLSRVDYFDYQICNNLDTF